MKMGRVFAAAVLFGLASQASHAVEHWTGEVEKLTVFEDGTAFMIILNPRGGPVGTLNCTQNVVYLGVKNTQAPKELFAQVMTVYAMAKTMRFGVRGSGDACEAYYVTAEP